MIATGANRITSTGWNGSGYVDGNFRLRIRSDSTTTAARVGHNGNLTEVWLHNIVVDTQERYLTVSSFDQVLPGLSPSTSVSRYWRFVKEGSITASLQFTYTDAEMNGNENDYKLWRKTTGDPVLVPATLNTFGNTITVTTSEFDGDWGIGAGLQNQVSVSGSVFTSGGAGIRNALVTISGGSLPAPVTFQTGQFGTYSFNGLQSGETYTISVSAKRYRFTPSSRQITPVSDLTNVNFTANPQE